MSQIQFRELRGGEKGLELHGSRYQARLEAHPLGIWRVLVWHRPEDQHKPSWIVSPFESQKIEFQLSEQGAQIDSETIGTMDLKRSPFGWSWSFLRALGVSSDSPFLRQDDLPPAGMRHPALDLSDGLPRGSGLTLHFDLQEADAFYGLGERTGFLNKRGRLWKNWTTDEFFHTPQADPLYQSHPFVIVRRGKEYLGVFLDESWYSSFDLGYTDQDTWSIYTAGPTLDLYLIPGPTPEAILERYSALTGRAPLPPLWALGVHQCRWSYPDQESVLAVAEAYQRHNLPLDALWLDIDHMQGYRVFSFSSQRFPEPLQMTRQLEKMGYKTVVIVDPGVKQENNYVVYEAGRKIQAYIRNEQDQELVGEVWPKPVVWPDFSRSDVRSWWGKNQEFYLQEGIAGLWIDMNEPSAFNWKGKTLPLNARQGKSTHAEMHNLYGYQMAQATAEGLLALQPEKRPFVLTRSGGPGIQKFAFVWTGDNSSYWEHLENSLPMLMNLGLSGVPFVGADIGGFSGDSDGELLTRWTWLGALYPFMRNHAGKGSRRQEPWQFGEPWLSHIRKALQFRYQIMPYLYSQAKLSSVSGQPILRPLLFDYPEDSETWALHDQCLLGSDLLAAPALRPEQTKRAVYLPAGHWQDFWTTKRYSGGEWILVDTPLDRLPLFQKSGTALPLLPPGQKSAHAHWDELYWSVAPEDTFAGRVWQDAGEGFEPGYWRELSGSWDGDCLQIIQTPAVSCKVVFPILSQPLRANLSFEYDAGQLILQLSDRAEVNW
ncbi:alpha-glucosidase [bacterium (Candidatus Blackallbacteria) CG17_big_fil_post_rev_8_21_14_2_50_48_46]|uniref:Alpha-glucosidase n=1 Tax=bacterium (Candidatus Blackallbacteria) CG17_big_fil_post_rev_8_21_14_2_50_48_46 TaxID=2014261 RepID=A0A2M7G8J0_9BACT|nr:MAG: alpha-glucosidase [bacterium (Candidatus Blackallbacteria) CG18_big_fil_WC_8_21_14_2_50_49_26]PIW18426.1 MAG: alpha-glucosidase [bacterium (Candidatus Blackallbacteria) CG17_big_fil_post_rev_8_21_14_2_50_48_46]PIW46589.1 MAG: alpha-glucosidase [bacterium (Candidatus Blackallbacteria) CG13_big_fil_rev_8_21_14_2_50_49_14]